MKTTSTWIFFAMVSTILIACGQRPNTPLDNAAEVVVATEDVGSEVMGLAPDIEQNEHQQLEEELHRLFNEACSAVDAFTVPNRNQSPMDGFWWNSDLDKDRQYPNIRLGEALRSDYSKLAHLVIERRPQPYNNVALGYDVSFEQDQDGVYRYIVGSSKFVNGEQVEEDRTPITSSVQMRVALAPFYERLWQAMTIKQKEDQKMLAKLMKTS